MIENFQSGLIWNTIKKCPYIINGLKRAVLVVDGLKRGLNEAQVAKSDSSLF